MIPRIKEPKLLDNKLLSEIEEIQRKALERQPYMDYLLENIYKEAFRESEKKEQFLNRQFLMLVRKERRKGAIKGRLTKRKIERLGYSLIIQQEVGTYIGKMENGKLKRVSTKIYQSYI